GKGQPRPDEDNGQGKSRPFRNNIAPHTSGTMEHPYLYISIILNINILYMFHFLFHPCSTPEQAFFASSPALFFSLTKHVL
ncbi:hypothetical protein, partial [Akkermansia sp.]|uniref:hypothetical protein n=1 Tax=Akkermansia sp. TaxID=1872421 RepID=UPI00399CEB86